MPRHATPRHEPWCSAAMVISWTARQWDLWSPRRRTLSQVCQLCSRSARLRRPLSSRTPRLGCTLCLLSPFQTNSLCMHTLNIKIESWNMPCQPEYPRSGEGSAHLACVVGTLSTGVRVTT